MIIRHKGVDYEIARWSDVIRDGMYLELSQPNTNPLKQMAEVFYSDVTHEFTFSCFVEDVPLNLIELLIERARVDLPPLKKDE